MGWLAIVTISDDMAGALARLTAIYPPPLRTRVAAPAGPLRRKPGDTTPNGLSDNYGYARNTNDNRKRGGRIGGHFKPDAAHFAYNPVPATARVTATEKPQGGMPQKAPVRYLVTENEDGTKSRVRVHGTGDLTPEQWRLWALERGNLARDTGDLPVPGTDYPCGLTAKGNPAPSPAAYLASLDEHAAISEDRHPSSRRARNARVMHEFGIDD